MIFNSFQNLNKNLKIFIWIYLFNFFYCYDEQWQNGWKSWFVFVLWNLKVTAISKIKKIT